MPRSSRSGGGRSAPSGARGSHTMASQRSQTQPATVPHAQPPMQQQQQQGRSPGLFGQVS